MTAPTRDELVGHFLGNRTVVQAATPLATLAELDQQTAVIRDALTAAGLDLDDPDVAETVMRLARVLDAPGALLIGDWPAAAHLTARADPRLAMAGVAQLFTLGWVAVTAAERIDQGGLPA